MNQAVSRAFCRAGQFLVVVVAASFLPFAAFPRACPTYSMASRDQVFDSEHRVFAHYIDVFKMSMDNKDWAVDYYNRTWLLPVSGNMWFKNGGFLRARPLPVPVRTSKSQSEQENMAIEVRMAVSRGISGFTFDIGDEREIAPEGGLRRMLKAAATVDQRFSIVLMVDRLQPNAVVHVVEAVYDDPNVYRFKGQVVVAPYRTDTLSPDQWKEIKDTLKSRGHPIFLLATFLSLPKQVLQSYGPVADGFGLFGTALVDQDKRESENWANVSALGKPYMTGISPQGYRPKSFRYWETSGSSGYRNGWMAAVKNRPQWVQLTTWNDFSESTQVEPYTNSTGKSVGIGYFDLTGYFASWYVTGSPPKINSDSIYYFYRAQPVAAASPNAGEQTVAASSGVVGTDLIEAVALLVKPARLSITVDGEKHSAEVDAGLQSLSVPFAPGVPRFEVMRGNRTVVSLSGGIAAVGASGLPNGYSDLTYWTGGASAQGACAVEAGRLD